MSRELQQDLLLIGGGHSHCLVLKQWAMRPLPDTRITLVSPQLHATYSGMLPGLIAGHYEAQDLQVDLLRLCCAAGAQFLRGSVSALEVNANRARVGRHWYDYDAVSLDVGVNSALSVDGAETFAVPVKPINEYFQHWQSSLQAIGRRSQQGAFHIVVVGAGAGGVELILAMQHRLRGLPNLHFHLLGASEAILPTYPPRARQLARKALARAGVRCRLRAEVMACRQGELMLASGESQPFDDLHFCTGASAAPWLKESGLDTDEQGFVAVNECLLSTSHSNVFAAGDCASFQDKSLGKNQGKSLPKAGVFAVRQAPVLARNIAALFSGSPLQAYRPQRHFLSQISLGEKRALACRNGLTLSGAWVWRWKARIDRRFIDGLRQLPIMAANKVADADDMRCGGCGGKVAADVIHKVLGELRAQGRLAGSADDAAVMDWPGGKLVQSVDYFRLFIQQPYLSGQVAATHALNDLYAMNAKPHSAQALVTLPPASERVNRRLLKQFLLGALSVLDRHHCQLVGGHTSEGGDAGIGFVVNGLAGATIFSKGGADVGDLLIVTKPLGSGHYIRALQQASLPGTDFEALQENLLINNQAAAGILAQHQAVACTDVSGFGLLGHLKEMLLASGNHCAARLCLDEIPLLPKATELATSGWLSSIHAANARLQIDLRDTEQWRSDPAFNTLFDPQTSGGLLAALRADRAQSCLEQLKIAGYRAAIIGEVVARVDDFLFDLYRSEE